jgi:UDP-N-acetylglucosamine 2-epimerase (non-hydrolysing)
MPWIDNLLSQFDKLNNDHGEIFPLPAEAAADKVFFPDAPPPSNVDDPQVFGEIAAATQRDRRGKGPYSFPSNPRTRKQITQLKINLRHLSTCFLPYHSRNPFTSGRTQRWCSRTAAASWKRQRPLGIPCVTIRENTERPITVEIGTNILAGTKRENIVRAYGESIEKAQKASVPPLWGWKGIGENLENFEKQF